MFGHRPHVGEFEETVPEVSKRAFVESAREPRPLRSAMHLRGRNVHDGGLYVFYNRSEFTRQVHRVRYGQRCRGISAYGPRDGAASGQHRSNQQSTHQGDEHQKSQPQTMVFDQTSESFPIKFHNYLPPAR